MPIWCARDGKRISRLRDKVFVSCPECAAAYHEGCAYGATLNERRRRFRCEKCPCEFVLDAGSDEGRPERKTEVPRDWKSDFMDKVGAAVALLIVMLGMVVVAAIIAIGSALMKACGLQ